MRLSLQPVAGGVSAVPFRTDETRLTAVRGGGSGLGGRGGASRRVCGLRAHESPPPIVARFTMKKKTILVSPETHAALLEHCRKAGTKIQAAAEAAVTQFLKRKAAK